MRQVRRSLLVLVGILVALLATPAGTLAADSVTLTGTIVRDGAPVTGVEVVIAVPANGIIVSTASDENGWFAVELEAGVGSGLEIHATGRTSRSGPDPKGCVRSETPTGRLDTVIAAVPPDPVTVELSRVQTSKVCSAAGKPRAKPRMTLPPTDAAAAELAGSAGSTGAGLLVVLGVLSLTGAGVLSRRSRTQR